MTKLIATVALATVLASPAFAQSYDPDVGTGNIVAPITAPVAQSGAQNAFAQVGHAGAAHARHLNRHGGARSTSPYEAYGAVTPFGSPGVSGDGKNLSAARATSIRECSTAAAAYREYTWGDMEIQQYRACMAQHGQAE